MKRQALSALGQVAVRAPRDPVSKAEMAEFTHLIADLTLDDVRIVKRILVAVRELEQELGPEGAVAALDQALSLLHGPPN